jgi:hypothetical protein
MIEYVARRNTQVIGVRSLEVLEVTPDLIVELEPHLRLRAAAAHDQLVATVSQTQPVEPVGTISKRAAQDH